MNKWIELNIFLKDYSRTNDVLYKTISPYIKELYDRNLKFNWHFFREPEIRLRIFANSEEIERIKVELDTNLTNLEKLEDALYCKHLFGCHGKEGGEYNGEEEFYGKDAWELCYKRWEIGSNLALLLCAESMGKSLPFYATRDIHLFLNQLGLEPSDEITVCLKWAMILMGNDGIYSPYNQSLKDLVIFRLNQPTNIKEL